MSDTSTPAIVKDRVRVADVIAAANIGMLKEYEPPVVTRGRDVNNPIRDVINKAIDSGAAAIRIEVAAEHRARVVSAFQQQARKLGYTARVYDDASHDGNAVLNIVFAERQPKVKP